MAINERLVITGASGKLGWMVIKEILARGISNIIATTRTPDSLAEICGQRR